MFALSRTGFPLDNRLSRFVPDVLEKNPSISSLSADYTDDLDV
jgi:hypothetical protein